MIASQWRALLACGAVLCVSRSVTAQQPECTPLPLGHAQTLQLAHAIARFDATRRADPVPEHVERTGLSMGARCLQLATLSWEGVQGGGVVVYELNDTAGAPRVEFAWPARGAHSPTPLTGGRFLFVEVSGWGNGTREELARVMCPVEGGSWLQALTLTAYRMEVTTGAPPNYKDSPYIARSTFSAHGDTLIVDRTDSWGSAESGGPRIKRSVSRIVMP